MNYKKILFILFLFYINILFAQFNTVQYKKPAVEVDTIEVSKQVKKEVIDDNKSTPTTSKREKRKRISKKELINEIDSLKIQIKKLLENQKKQEVENQSKYSDNQELKIKKFNLIEEENFLKKISMPLDDIKITSSFGIRKHPINGKVKMHNGIDLKANYEPVYAVLNGIVTEVGWDKKGGGNYIKIQHSDKYQTSYLHLDKFYCKVGDVIKTGEIIAKSGNSGNSTAPHLHFAVKKEGKFINPKDFLNQLIKINNLISIYNE